MTEETVIWSILGCFNYTYFISVILLTYLLVKLFFQKTKTGTKQVITLVMGVVLGIIWVFCLKADFQQILPTFALSVIVYDFVIKRLLKFIKVGYKSDEHK